MDREQYLRGLLRGFTSDVVGGPVDIAEQLANLGIAGYGFAGHKLGLLNAEQLPKLLEASPGTSEWFARKAGNPDPGTGEYLAGRVTPALLGLAKGGSTALLDRLEELPAAAAAGSKQAQRGAVRVGGEPGLYIGHNAPASDPNRFRWSGGPAMYGHSFGVTADRVPNFNQGLDSGGGMLLLPRLGALDPATYDTRLWNRDAWVQRSKGFPGRKLIESGNGARSPLLLDDRGLARRNLAFTERQELTMPPHKVDKDPAHKAALLNSPNFRSFEEFEKSPGGLAALRSYQGSASTHSARAYGDFSAEIGQALLALPSVPIGELSNLARQSKKLLYYPAKERDEIVRRLSARHPEFAQNVAQIAKMYRQRFAALPTEYGELQQYGLLPITPDNFAGAFVTEGTPGSYSSKVRQAFGRLPVISKKPGDVKTSDLDELLAEAGPARTARKGLIKSFGGLPTLQKAAPLNPMQKYETLLGDNWDVMTPDTEIAAKLVAKYPDKIPTDVADDMIAVLPSSSLTKVFSEIGKLYNKPKHSNNPLNPPDLYDLQVIGLAKKPPTSWSAADLSDATQWLKAPGNNTHPDFKGLAAAKKKAVKIMPAEALKEHVDSAKGLAAGAKAKPADPSLLKNFSVDQFEQGNFDYLTNLQLDALEVEAVKLNDPGLTQALKAYKNILQEVPGPDVDFNAFQHDEKLYTLLNIWDLAKTAKPKGLAAGADVNPWPFGKPASKLFNPTFEEFELMPSIITQHFVNKPSAGWTADEMVGVAKYLQKAQQEPTSPLNKAFSKAIEKAPMAIYAEFLKKI